jgi:hypothetical protein
MAFTFKLTFRILVFHKASLSDCGVSEQMQLEIRVHNVSLAWLFYFITWIFTPVQ